MKNPYFKFVEIEKSIVEDFLKKHQSLKPFINLDNPFFVRVSKKPYAGLIHTIISDNESNEKVIQKWNQLMDFAKKIKPKNVAKISLQNLTSVVGENKGKLIFQLTQDVLNKHLDLKTLSKQPEQIITDTLSKYAGLNSNTIGLFTLFSCFKQNVLCDFDEDFITGLKIFLNKEKIEQQDINNIKTEYEGELSLFSLCMWRIRNERKRK